MTNLDDLFISDLREVLFRVRVRFGWRAQVAKRLLLLAAWVGGAQIQFIGDEHG